MKLVTHDGSFHTDDVFACATLCLLLEKKGEKFEIIRTRDLEVIKTGDYVFDVGGEYNPETNRFDHHQIGGAGKHDDGIEGIEYASFGLVWKKFGIELCGNEKVVRLIEERLVSPVDAGDNGFDLVENKYEVSPYFIQHFFSSMRPSWTEENLSDDEMFLKCVSVAKMILTREIIQAKGKVSAEESLITIYKNSKDKRIIVLDKNYPFEYVLNKYLEPLFVIYPRKSDGFWGVKAVREDPKTFNNRKDFPKSWAGLRDHELQKITGVSDSIFCHRGLFLAVAKSKEGAIKLAQLALQTL
ncbi:MAG: MYG1 family protein [bacterium]|nr:MYG1 family protein [bacterium]